MNHSENWDSGKFICQEQASAEEADAFDRVLLVNRLLATILSAHLVRSIQYIFIDPKF